MIKTTDMFQSGIYSRLDRVNKILTEIRPNVQNFKSKFSKNSKIDRGAT